MSRFFRWREAVSRLYDSNPTLANSFTGFVTFFAGDATSQLISDKVRRAEASSVKNSDSNSNISSDSGNGSLNGSKDALRDGRHVFSLKYLEEEEQPFKVNFTRAFTTGLLGVIMNGAALTIYYRVLEKLFGTSRELKTVVVKMVVDQLAYAPFSILVYFAHATHLEKDFLRNTEDAKEMFFSKCSDLLKPTYISDCSFWPFVNFINFKYIPLNYRPSFVSIAQYMWQTYLSSIAFGHGHYKPTHNNNNNSNYSNNAVTLSEAINSPAPALLATATALEQQESQQRRERDK